MFLPIILVCNLTTMDLSVDPPIVDCQNLYARVLEPTLEACEQSLVDNGIPYMYTEYQGYTPIIVDCLEVNAPALPGIMS
jgi:hypothetical protein